MGNKVEGENIIEPDQQDKKTQDLTVKLPQESDKKNTKNQDIPVEDLKKPDIKEEKKTKESKDEIVKSDVNDKEKDNQNQNSNNDFLIDQKNVDGDDKINEKKTRIKDNTFPFVHKFPKNDEELGYEDEIHNNLNFGKPIKILNKIWLTYNFKIIPDPSGPKLSINFIPKGWKIPSIQDIIDITKNTKIEAFYFLTQKLKMKSSSIYVTSTKSFPGKIIGNDEDSWYFKSVLVGKNEFEINDTNLFKYKDSLSCKLISSDVLEDIEFDSPIVTEVNKPISFKIPIFSNITTFEWDFDDGNTSKKETTFHTFRNVREHKVVLKLILYSNRNYNIEKNIWVVNEIKQGEDEIINDINYGPPVLIGNQVWMKFDMVKYLNFEKRMVGLSRGWGPGKNGENSYIDSVACCPLGWRLPTKTDIEQLLDYSGNTDMQRVQFLLLNHGFGAKLNNNSVCQIICFDLVDDLGIIGQKYRKNEIPNEMLGKSGDYGNIKNFKDLNVSNLDKHINNTVFFNNLKYYDSDILENMNYYDITRKSAYCLEINTNKVFISSRSTSMTSLTSFFSTRLIASDNFELDLGIPEKDPFINESISFEIKHPNLISCSWDFGDNSTLIKDNKSPKHAYTKEGNYEITVNLLFFGNRVIIIKKKIFIQNYVNYPTFFNGEEQIFTQKLEFTHCKRIEAIHFTFASSTIIPRREGGMYLVYHDILDYKLKVLKLNSKPFIIQDFIFEKEFLTHLDAVATDLGICMLLTDIRDPDYLFLMLINEKGEIIFKRNIMQNGSLPINAFNDQLMFINPITVKPYHGMNAMHKPKTGKLCYGKGKILAIFSYYNYFGYSKMRDREDNNGDSILVFNEDGSDVHLASIWSTSHSLKVSTSFDGRYFYTASLGDALPQNIKLVRVDPLIQNILDNYKNQRKIELNNRSNPFLDKNIINNESNFAKFSIINSLNNIKKKIPKNKIEPELGTLTVENKSNKPFNSNLNDLILPDLRYDQYLIKENSNKKYISEANSFIQYDSISVNLVDGIIPGDMMGQSSGRLGSLIHLGGSNSAITYSRIPCSNHFGDVNKLAEFGIFIINNDLATMKKIILFDSDDVNCIKSARYGDNIFIMFSTTDRRFGPFLSDYVTTHDRTFGILVNSEGFTVSDCIEIKNCKFNTNDEFVTLKDGSLAWTYIDDSNQIRICLLNVEENKKFTIGQKNNSVKKSLNTKQDLLSNEDEGKYNRRPKDNIIVMKKNINDKKYECYVEKTKNEEITMDIKEKDEKLKQLSKKTVDFIPKDVFKVQNKNYDFITEGRTFKLNVERPTHFQSQEKIHNFLKKNLYISKTIDEEKKSAEPQPKKKHHLTSEDREHKFLRKDRSES